MLILYNIIYIIYCIYTIVHSTQNTKQQNGSSQIISIHLTCAKKQKGHKQEGRKSEGKRE